MTPLDYDFLRKLVKDRSGLVLSADKQYLVESRLLPVARKAGLTGLSDLVRQLKGANAQALVVEVVEAMMTNESFFFRDKLPFEHFRETIIPARSASAASSGENGAVRFRRTVIASITSTLATGRNSPLRFEPGIVLWRSMLNFTAAASNFSPS